MSVSKMIMGQAANRYVDPVYVENLFNTQLYTGDNSVATQTFNTGLDMQNEGGMIWFKSRSNSQAARIIDTERGTNQSLIPTSLNGSGGLGADGLTFLNNGFSIGWDGGDIAAANNYVAWSFRQAPKFFDIVTYSGNSQTSQTIAHSLGSAPGMMLIKRTDGYGYWWVYHKSIGATDMLLLDRTNAKSDYAAAFNDTEPTATHFTVGSDSEINYNGRSYVAYLFADNDGDGGFGLTNDQDIIKCGTYNTDGNGDATVNLGFEPQFVLVKSSTATSNWYLLDTMRGMSHKNPVENARLYADTSGAESSTGGTSGIIPTSTGFFHDGYIAVNQTFIYMAIRRGDMAVPTDATKVFSVNLNTGGGNVFTTGFAGDMNLATTTSGNNNFIISRLTDRQYLMTDSTSAETTLSSSEHWNKSNTTIDLNTGYFGSSAGTVSYTWKRAPGYFDVCCYTGTGSARTVSHNLGVAPEMMWVKTRDTTYSWTVFHSALGNNKGLYINSAAAVFTNTATWNNTAPTSTVFSVNNDGYTNKSGDDFIAYLFATVAGVSKVGTYIGNSSDGKQIDCGFSSGARFVLLKNTTVSNTNWLLFDTVRGIVTGNDARLYLNTTDNQNSGTDYVDPYSSGFELTANAQVNHSGSTYIFYAIA